MWALCVLSPAAAMDREALRSFFDRVDGLSFRALAKTPHDSDGVAKTPTNAPQAAIANIRGGYRIAH